MINPQANEVLVRDRQLELVATAQRARLARQTRQAGRAGLGRLRTRAGWWMVQAGIRMVLSAHPPAAQPHHTVAPSNH